MFKLKNFSACGMRRRALRLAGILMLALTAPLAPMGSASANGDVIHIASGRNTQVTIAKGKPKTIRTNASYYEIVVGDPNIANVTPLTDRSFYVLGNQLGTTGIALFDKNKRMVGSVDIEVTLDTERLASTIRQVVPDAHITVESANGRLILSGTARDAVAAEKASDIAARFSGEEEVINSVDISSSQQVQLNVRFVEINRQVGQELGTTLGVVYRWGSGGVSFNSQPRATSSIPAGDIIADLTSGGLSVDLAIEALEERGVARMLAQPNLIARSGHKASFLAGGEFPIPVASSEGTISVDYKRYGVGLEFTPTVLSDGLISLDIAPEVSSVDTSSSYQVGDIAIPGFVVRRAQTSVDLKSGQSFMMAGLLQTQNNVNTQRIPGLGKLPVLGPLFSSKAYQRRQTDLVIIVTPYLVKPMDPTMRPATPFDSSGAPSTADAFLGNMEEVTTASAPGAVAMRPAGGHFLELSETRR